MSFKEFKESLKANVKDKKASTAFSKSTMEDMIRVCLNDPEYVLTSLVKDGESYREVTMTPAANVRDSLVDLLKRGGMDEADAKDLMGKYTFTKKQAEALYELVVAIMAEYLDTGKSFRFPRMAADETVQQIQKVVLPEKESKHRVPVEENGKRSMKETGDVIVTAARTGLKAKNGVLPEMKSIKK